MSPPDEGLTEPVPDKTRLTDQNLGEARPSRWVELLLYDHPPYYRRIEHARYYQAQRGEIG